MHEDWRRLVGNERLMAGVLDPHDCYYHIVPHLNGQAEWGHILDDYRCWCEPYPDRDFTNVIVHRKTQ